MLGEDVELVVEPYDETNTVLPIKKIIQSLQQSGNGLVGFVNVQGRKSRRRSADDIDALIRANLGQGIRRFFITDDTRVQWGMLV